MLCIIIDRVAAPVTREPVSIGAILQSGPSFPSYCTSRILSAAAHPEFGTEKAPGHLPWRVAPQVRLELTTLRLTAECSAIELLRIILPFLWFGFLCLCLVVSACLWLSLLVSGFLRLCLGAGKTSVSPAPPGSRQLPTLPSRSQLSTISVWRLNFCVRYGYRWCPPAIVTGNFPFGALFIASRPLRFALRFRFAHSPLLSLPLPAPSKLHRSELTRKHSLIFAFPLALRALASSAFPVSASFAP